MSNIDFVMCIRDRDNSRIQRCIDSFKKYANKIYVIDYNSKVKPNIKYAEVIRYDDKVVNKIWNKSYALNLGIKKCKSDYICTIDCDMILNKELLDLMINSLDKDTVIFNTNVRRIDIKYLSNNYDEMLYKSKLWFEKGSRGNIYSSANGGIQVFPREWINEIGGYDEGLGLYWGAMDNRVYEQAKGLSMTVIDLNIPMLHQEHKKTKESNLDKEEMDFAQKVRAFKIGYLNELMIKRNFISNRNWGGKEPNHNWMIKLVEEWSKGIVMNKNYSKDEVKVYISIVTNYEQLPTYFVLDLIKIIGRARNSGIKVLLNNPRGAAIDSIRNNSVMEAIDTGATHLLQLDVDHLYPEDIVIRLLEHDKDFVCGITSKRNNPYTQTQFKDVSLDMVGVKENVCKFKGDEGLVKIGATGMVGSLIKTDIFKKMKYPYYKREYKIRENQVMETGEDIYFCRQLLKYNIDLWCDTSLSYPHHVTNAFVDKGKMSIMI